MPLFLEPEQRFPIVLDSDMDKPKESRPTFFAKSLTMRQQQKLSSELDASLEHETTEQIFAATCELLCQYLTGWQHMGSYVFGTNTVDEFLSHGEARELLRKILANQHVQLDEKKKLRVAAHIRFGQLCKNCTSKQCLDLGTEQEPIEIRCPACSGRGCDECHEGMYRVMGCPQAYCKQVVPAINLIDLFDKGLPPVGGGVLDQAAWFLDAVRVLHHDEQEIESELRKR